ncbi:hypothetical protein [Humibacillus xanthopallidus]|uniref:hypothetical protein n=1 Tax=Humibacillus xanthopallidus TaxID=412689 RepID=UPI0011547D60|nr:hypothetical protein [Humibacillus xanthopallidus]
MFNGDLYCAVAANVGSGSLVFLSTGDGLAWSTPTTVPEADVLPPARPSLLAFGIALYWFLPGTQDGGPLAMCSVLD